MIWPRKNIANGVYDARVLRGFAAGALRLRRNVLALVESGFSRTAHNRSAKASAERLQIAPEKLQHADCSDRHRVRAERASSERDQADAGCLRGGALLRCPPA